MKYLADYTPDEAQREAVRQTERQLEAQQSLASSSDQRAIAFTGLTLVIVAVLFDRISKEENSIVVLVALGQLLLGGGFAAYTARPIRFFASGGTAAGFYNYVTSPSCGYLLSAIAERNDEYIQANDRRIKNCARMFLLGVFFAFDGVAMLFISEII